MTITVLNAPASVKPGEELWLTDPRIGIVMNDSADQGAKLQAAIALAGTAQKDASLRIPPGFVKNDSVELALTGLTRPIKIQGSGTGDQSSTGAISAIKYSELGAGKYALRGNSGFGADFRDFALVGPKNTVPIGTAPATMDGLDLPTRAECRGLLITGFNNAVGLMNDHHQLFSCDLKGNGCALHWYANPTGGIADERIDNCAMNDQKIASIRVHSDAAIANAVFIQGHIGMAPYGILRYGSLLGARPGFMQGVVFHNTSFENCQNGEICDITGEGVGNNIGDGQMSNVYFLPMASSGTGAEGGFYWASMPSRASIDVGGLDGVEWAGQPPLWNAAPGTISGIVKGAIRAQYVRRTRVYQNLNAFIGVTTNGTQTKIVELVAGALTSGIDVEANAWGGSPGGGGTIVSFAPASGAISKYDLLETIPGKVKRSTNNSAAQVRAHALHDCVDGQMCHYLIQGSTAACKVANKTGAQINNGTLVKPDTGNAGGVASAVRTDPDQYAKLLEDAPPAGFGRADIRLAGV